MIFSNKIFKKTWILIVYFNMVFCKDLSLSELIKKLNWSHSEIIERGKVELAVFVKSNLWQGGYREGNPTDLFGTSSYPHLFPYKGKQVSPLFICFFEYLFPRITEATNILEIGSGGSAWTKAMLNLNPRSITCVDALSAEHNQFWNYVSNCKEKVRYYQINDFSLDCIPDNSIDLVFSYGVFCHISPIEIYEYLKNIYPKLRFEAECFIMYADYDRYNADVKKYACGRYINKDDEFKAMQNVPIAGAWYHLGVERMFNILRELGYQVISPDVNIDLRDPIAHFKKISPQ